MEDTHAKQIVLGFDISGTEIRMEMFEQRGRHLNKIGDRMLCPLKPGFANIIAAISHMATNAVGDMPVRSLSLALGVPARFEREDGSFPEYEDGSAIVQQNVSGIHLGADCVGRNWQQALTEALEAELPRTRISVALMNDAGVQLAALVKHAQAHSPDAHSRWSGGTLVYLGPGTGFGASIADVDGHTSQVHVRHNAHMYDALVEITPRQREEICRLFSNYHIIDCEKRAKCSEFDQLDLQTYGHLFPLKTGEKRNIYLIHEGERTFILPARFFASKDGLEHLMAHELTRGTSMKLLGQCTPEQMQERYPEAYAKLSLIGELMGSYLQQFAAGTLERLPLSKGTSPIAYDRGQRGLSKVKGILLGGGAMRDGIGEVLEAPILNAIQHSERLSKAEIYRPDTRQCDVSPSSYLCETAAQAGCDMIAKNR